MATVDQTAVEKGLGSAFWAIPASYHTQLPPSLESQRLPHLHPHIVVLSPDTPTPDSALASPLNGPESRIEQVG